ncbi:hypothetical protein [Actinophytocola xanthii]|nr:hypothetical protein [Actinophytocola xanthii]
MSATPIVAAAVIGGLSFVRTGILPSSLVMSQIWDADSLGA